MNPGTNPKIATSDLTTGMNNGSNFDCNNNDTCCNTDENDHSDDIQTSLQLVAQHPFTPPSMSIDTMTHTATMDTTNDSAVTRRPESRHEIPTNEELVSQCWACRVPLHRPAPRRPPFDQDTREDDHEDRIVLPENDDTTIVVDSSAASLYAMHTHEILGHVPLCCICAEEVAANEQQQLSSRSSYCSGCAISEEDYDGIFFICDHTNTMESSDENDTHETDECCSRVFCFHCVAKSYGGGTNGVATAHMLAKDDNTPWIGPCCETPTELQSLQQKIVEYYQLQNALKPRNDLTYLLQELLRAEEEKEHCEEMLSPVKLEQQKLDIQHDIVRDTTKNTVDDEDMDELVQMEFDQWYEAWNHHERRISDYISVLLDELDIDHQYTAVMSYQAIGKMTIPLSLLGDKNTGTIPFPVIDEDWVRAADHEVDQRIQQRKSQPIRKVLPDAAYETEDFHNVEELDSDSDLPSQYPNRDEGTETLSALQMRSDGFALNVPRPSHQSILSAIQHESELLKVQVKCHITEDQDEQYIYAETTRRTILVRDSSTTKRRRNRRSSDRSSQTNHSTPEGTTPTDPSSFDQGDKNTTSVFSNGPTTQKNFDSIMERNKSDTSEAVDGPLEDNDIVAAETDANIPASCTSPTNDDQFYDCTTDPVDPIDNSMEGIAQMETSQTDPNKDVVDDMGTSLDATPWTPKKDPNKVEDDDMESALEATPWTTLDDKNGDESVDRDVVSTPSRQATESSSKNGEQEVNMEQTVLGIVTKALTPSQLSSRIISIATSNKKRLQASSLMEPPNVNDTPLKKKKKQTAAKTVSSTRVQDPTDVTYQIPVQGQHPPMILCQSSDAPNKDGKSPIRTVRVSKKLWAPLKPHQIEGVRFMWRNCFADFAYYEKGNTAQCGGCILAHNMGLVRVHGVVCGDTIVGCIAGSHTLFDVFRI